MRLEVLELIQLQVESLEEETNVEVTEGKDTSEAEGKDLGGSVSGAMQAIVVPENVAFEDIMDTAQELRVLVSKRGMDSMLVGALLNTPTALLPLQDIEDNSQQDSSEKDSSDTDSKAGENSHPNSPMTPSSAVKIRFVDQKRGKKESVDGKEKKRKKLMQTTALIESMEATAKELAEQVGKLLYPVRVHYSMTNAFLVEAKRDSDRRSQQVGVAEALARRENSRKHNHRRARAQVNL